MACTLEFVEMVCDKIADVGDVSYKKMFGDYMVYVNAKPVLTLCDNVVYVKTEKCIADIMADAPKGVPYEGAKERYILDIDNDELCKAVVRELEKVTPVPKKRKK